MADLLSTKPYKGTRDFYPPEMRSREWMFSVMSKTAESYGFERYDAPLLEPIDIYLAKTSEEIVKQQIYAFTDRGERRVAIRPEMTPTVARLVAARAKETPRPIRWYSIPNLWRYEQPGKGRLREHWQLNCDIFGAQNEFLADAEILQLAVSLLRSYGADSRHFRLFLSHRELLNAVFAKLLNLPNEKFAPVARIMDKKAKISVDEYRALLHAEGLDDRAVAVLDSFLQDGITFLDKNSHLAGAQYILSMIKFCRELGLADYIEYDPSVVRGFDYYTGLVFEVFDRHPNNRRSLFGGGRYDNLTSAFIKEKINAVGFGMGDVTLEDFLRVHGLYKEFPRKTEIYVALFDEEDIRLAALKLAGELRSYGFSVETALSSGKLGKQFEEAGKKEIPLVLVLGSDELAAGQVQVKDMRTGEQTRLPLNHLADKLRQLVAEKTNIPE